MAKQFAFSDPRTGAPYPAAVSLPTDVQVFFRERRAKITFPIWPSKDLAEAGREPIAGADRVYALSGAPFLAMLLSEPDGPGLLNRVSNACYAAVDDGFFDGATDIEVSLPAPAEPVLGLVSDAPPVESSEEPA